MTSIERLLVGTNNAGKFIEISQVLCNVPITLLQPKDLSITSEPEETGETFEENALQKAKHFAQHSKLPTIADDSGILVEALENELGVHTRRWGAGPEATDEEWIRHFLERMKDEPNKRAHFVCCLSFIHSDGSTHTFEGRCSGEITPELEADYLPGLPISACFKPDGCNSVFSNLSIEEKNSKSHRGKATQAFRAFLEDIL